MFYSPLRYPGGKNKLSKFIAKICFDNHINGHYIEPYAGGASVALYLLIENKVKTITINDFDRSIYAFRYSVLYETDNLCKLIDETDITIDNWKKLRQIQKEKDTADLLSLGFSTLFLNRTNVSGIINAGVIGGLKQAGNYKMDCRFNKKSIIEKVKFIANLRGNINLYNLDAIDLIKKIKKGYIKNAIFYFDPPYYLKGSSLYLNHYDHEQHIKVSREIMKINNIAWIVSYDNTPEIEDMYTSSTTYSWKYAFNHSAYRSKKGKEILFFNNRIDSKTVELSANLLPAFREKTINS